MSQPKGSAEKTATFGDVFGVGEFRALYSASALSWTGDYLARAAVAALIYGTTRSVLLSAASFAISYLPGLTAGPLLAALAERYPRRTVMIFCDAVRACLLATVAIPGVPVAALFVLLFAAALLNAPFDASRSALLAQILSGDRYIVAASAQNTTINFAMVLGYLAGGVAAPTYPHLTLAIDAATFVMSALLIRYGISVRPPALSVAQRTGLLRETAAGFRFVAGHRLLRAIAILSLGVTLLAIVPEGLAAAWAAKLTRNPSDQGIDQALIMMAGPIGLIVGAIVVGRLMNAALRRRLIRPFAIAVPITLALALLNPDVIGAAVITFVIGICVSGLFLPTNGLYAKALPTEFRARAFGVFQFGAQFVQALGLIVTGVLSDHFPLHVIVGCWGLMGIVLISAAVRQWPADDQIDAALDQAKSLTQVAAESAAATEPSSPAPAPVSQRRMPGVRRHAVDLNSQPQQRRRLPSIADDATARMNSTSPTGCPGEAQ